MSNIADGNVKAVRVDSYERHVVTAAEEASQEVTLIEGKYLTGTNSLYVFLNGVLLSVTDSYTETDEDTITFIAGEPGIIEDDVIIFLWFK